MTTLTTTEKYIPTQPGTSRRRTDLKGMGEAEIIRLLFTSAVASHLFQSNWRRGAGSTALEQEKSIEVLADLYTFRDYVQVANFLRQNPFLIGLLMRAYKEVQRYFGFNVEVALEVFTDPEAETEQELFALIQARLPLQEDIDLLERFNEEWWLDALPAARCKLTIDLE